MDVDLIILQERCRKDPSAYKEDFEMQQSHFLALVESTRHEPSTTNTRLSEVASFMGCVISCYKESSLKLGEPIVTILSESGPTMNPTNRKALVGLLGILRSKNLIDEKLVIPLFFKLLACHDKLLRSILHGHIISDLRRIQNSSKRHLQSFLFSSLTNSNEKYVKRILFVLIDLFRKSIWNDPKSANIIASTCFHESTSIAIIAAKFLLDSNVRNIGDDDDDDDYFDDDEAEEKCGHDGRKAADMWKAYNMTGRKSTKKRKRMEKVIARATKHKSASKSKGIVETDQASSAAMALLNDPQQFAERLFHSLQTSRKKDKYETKLVFINLLTRLIGGNDLILFEVYPYLQRYMQPAQPEVTRILAYLTQACHDLVPGDVLHPILRCISDRFVSDRSSPPSVAAGINTIRAICSRVPLAILNAENENLPEDEQEAPLLEDLVQYKSDRDKGVAMAARSLIGLYRELHPKLLHKKDRGRVAAEAVQKGQTAPAPTYAKSTFATGVDGVELLAGSDSEVDTENVESDLDDEEREEGETEHAQVDDDKIEKPDDEECEQGDLDEDDEESPENVDEEDENEVEYEEERDTSVVEQDSTVATIREDATRILTDADFKRIRAKRAARAVESANLQRARTAGDSVDPDKIQGVIRRERKTLEERLERVLAGREDRGQYGSKKGKKKGGGSSNSMKKKTKANSMVIHKHRRSNKLSRRDRQLAKRPKRDYR